VSAAPASASFSALGTTVVLWVTDAEALTIALELLEDELDRIDRACSRFRSDSELVALNARAGETVEVGEVLLEAIRIALRAAEATGGLVDPTVGRTLRLAGYDRTFSRVRTRDGESFRASFEPAAGWRRVEVDERRSTVRVPVGVELDLGATAKALAADRATRAAAERTGCGVLVSLGGDVAVAGPAPTGGWPIRIDADGPTVALSTGGLASSSTTVRTWRAGELRLHHIVDPRTGRPAETSWRTVSVAAASCVDANTASTAAVVLGARAPEWLAARELPARLASSGAPALCVAGWPEDPR
jgi:thiamine biosynthesis lipoprotein